MHCESPFPLTPSSHTGSAPSRKKHYATALYHIPQIISAEEYLGGRCMPLLLPLAQAFLAVLLSSCSNIGINLCAYIFLVCSYVVDRAI